MPIFRSSCANVYEKKDDDEQRKLELGKVYKAPELLFDDTPTQEADAYAFAIILVEIATRNDPYEVCFSCISDGSENIVLFKCF